MNGFVRGVMFWVAITSLGFAAETKGRVRSLKVTILSTMLADGDELGEWGFAALVEADGHRILFDTGAHTDVVLKNARSLKIDLGTVPEVMLSHWHSDHVGGFITLRDSVRGATPSALARTHVTEEIFLPRRAVPPTVEINPLVRIKPDYEKGGGAFVTHRGPVQLYPGVWLTGPVPRRFPEKNWSGTVKVTTAAGVVDDTVADDMSLVIDTEQGLVVVAGCGHAGVINILEHARSFIRPAKVHALIGGIHLFNASEETLNWTAGKLREFGIDNLIGAHCTGVETVYRFRRDLGLDRAHAVVGAVGAGFELGKGIEPGEIAR
jgi:7,8-dihydropterin-6-yl-methyl-4-(beta-D-ribofuranosyl)aminobenzene 5'-phosphate synthase